MSTSVCRLLHSSLRKARQQLAVSYSLAEIFVQFLSPPARRKLSISPTVGQSLRWTKIKKLSWSNILICGKNIKNGNAIFRASGAKAKIGRLPSRHRVSLIYRWPLGGLSPVEFGQATVLRAIFSFRWGFTWSDLTQRFSFPLLPSCCERLVSHPHHSCKNYITKIYKNKFVQKQTFFRKLIIQGKNLYVQNFWIKYILQNQIFRVAWKSLETNFLKQKKNSRTSFEEIFFGTKLWTQKFGNKFQEKNSTNKS